MIHAHPPAHMLPKPRREARERWDWDATPDLPYPKPHTMAAMAEVMARLALAGLRTPRPSTQPEGG